MEGNYASESYRDKQRGEEKTMRKKREHIDIDEVAL
jgi:hypothetical protein